MKSLLAQASSVERAVEKAWTDAGMPTEFTIKVLDFGEKGFLGRTKKRAIVSILYEPHKQTSVSKQTQTQLKRPASRPPRKSIKRPPRRPIKQEIQKPAPPKQPPKERLFWSNSLVQDISTWLTQIAKVIKIDTKFKTKIYKKALTIVFEGDVLGSQEEERLLFSGLSYLLMQFLKKKYKKKYQGYHLILTSKRFSK